MTTTQARKLEFLPRDYATEERVLSYDNIRPSASLKTFLFNEFFMTCIYD